MFGSSEVKRRQRFDLTAQLPTLQLGTLAVGLWTRPQASKTAARYLDRYAFLRAKAPKAANPVPSNIIVAGSGFCVTAVRFGW